MNKIKFSNVFFKNVLLQIFICMVLMLSRYSMALQDDRSHVKQPASESSYIYTAQNMIYSVGIYFQQIFEQVINYVYKAISVPFAHDVKIQIMGKRQPIVVDDEDLGDEGVDEQDDDCPPGNKICQKNLNFFNATFFSGLLNMNDQNSADVDKRDNEYRRMRMKKLNLLYGATDAKIDDEFSYK